MRTLIRFLTRTPSGAIETRDRIVDSDAITLGRATDRTLHLKDSRVALEHARILRSGSRTLLACKAPAQAIVNGSVRRDAELHVGDTVQIGANAMRVIEPPQGFDLAFTFELDATADRQAGASVRARLALGELGMSRRLWAWGLFVALLGFGLLVPLSGAMRDGGSESLRKVNLPSDRVWLPGPLHSSHAMLSSSCESCHEQPFVRVRNEACLTCHSSNLHSHVEAAQNLPVAMERLACTSCHAEHEEPARLVQTDQRICSTCHGGGAAGGSGESIPRATDFLADHPAFSDVRGVDVRGRAREEGLQFGHDVHLDPKGIKAPDGNVVMQCADCHQPEPGGARMQPVKMEQHCASCHRLDFDPAEPDRVVPHGDPKKVLASLIEYYGARYLAGYPDRLATAKPGRVVDLPAISISHQERERLLGLARERAETVARDLFERRVCVECHDVERKETDQLEWAVAKVSRTSIWMPAARFDHARHGTTLTPCKTCHDAASSKKAADVLMPDIDTCRTCHGGENGHGATGASLISSPCASCHAFHVEGQPHWTKDATTDADARPRTSATSGTSALPGTSATLKANSLAGTNAASDASSRTEMSAAPDESGRP